MSDTIERVQDVPQTSQLELNANAPGVIKTIKRNGKVVRYDDNKIKVAITKAFIAVEGGNAAASNRIHQLIDVITQQISKAFKRRLPSGGTIHIEDVQDQVELALMRSGEYIVKNIAKRVSRNWQQYRPKTAKLY